MKKTLMLLLLSYSTLQIFAQERVERFLPSDEKFKNIIEEFGSPLPGEPLMIINYFSTKTGSYLWFLNESKATKPSYLDENPKDLQSGIYLEDHGGLLPKIAFKDFAVNLSQPIYLTDFCLVQDADKDGYPEFYLTYFTQSDGLDAKPLKVIVYTTNKAGSFMKSKVTGWIPFQEEDTYRTEEDSAFKKLPKTIKMKAESLLESARNGMN